MDKLTNFLEQYFYRCLTNRFSRYCCVTSLSDLKLDPGRNPFFALENTQEKYRVCPPTSRCSPGPPPPRHPYLGEKRSESKLMRRLEVRAAAHVTLTMMYVPL